MGTLEVDKLDPQSGTALEIGTSGDTVTVPSGVTLTVAGALNVTGTTALADGTVNIAELDIDGGTDIGEAIVDADLFVIDNGAGGTNRKTAASRLTTYILGANSIDSDMYVDGSIDTAHIANDQITAALMADNSIDSDMYVDGSIDTAHIANDQITSALIADNAIDSDMYVDGSIDEAHIANAAVAVAKMKIEGETQLSEAPATGDELVIYDASATANKRINVSNFLKAQKIIQVVAAVHTTQVSVSSTSTTSYSDTGLTASLTTSAANSKVLCMYSLDGALSKIGTSTTAGIQVGLFKNVASAGYSEVVTKNSYWGYGVIESGRWRMGEITDFHLSSTVSSSGSSVAFKVQHRLYNGASENQTMFAQSDSGASSMILMEVGA